MANKFKMPAFTQAHLEFCGHSLNTYKCLKMKWFATTKKGPMLKQNRLKRKLKLQRSDLWEPYKGLWDHLKLIRKQNDRKKLALLWNQSGLELLLCPSCTCSKCHLILLIGVYCMASLRTGFVLEHLTHVIKHHLTSQTDKQVFFIVFYSFKKRWEAIYSKSTTQIKSF